jgi:hypothetical protein
VHPAPRADTTIQNGRITMSRDEEFPFYDDDVPMGEGLHWADASDDDDDDVG